ncbi:MULTISPECIES: ABC transporter substrate-binding protein [Clostridia]|uniref:ABC transporter substrate-binding protein n=1 Tax=Clostridia TaxID=186801 RepID=UPI000EAF7248|nr:MULTISPECIES: extracellular solute-binding protein [Clostridia]RKQ30722.1 extracellular solute-binding protein [Ruminococcus sp. B05]TAP33950.1 extracellular solute-binding protein [Mediterraneibacter sp. gm002]
MKKRVLAVLLSAFMVTGMVAGCGSSGSDKSSDSSDTKSESSANLSDVDFSGKDPQLTKKIKILTIWAEDNDNGILLNKICEDYQKNVNPNFDWEYEMVSSDNLQQKIATLAASDDLPDIFAYEAGAPLTTLIDSDKVVNVSEALDQIGETDKLNEGAVELLKGLSGTDDLYDLPLGLNVEGFWYNKELFKQAGCEVPTTWDEFEDVLKKLDDAGIQPLTTGGSDKWPATRLVNAYAVRTMGNDVMTKAANGDIDYTDKGLVEAADKIAEWADKGYFGQGVTTVDANTAGSMLMSGKAAIFYNGSWFTQNLTDDSQNPAGQDGIGFFNIPVADESVSSATSYSMNCGNILTLDKGKYDEATAWFLKYFCENMGDLAMNELSTVKGYTYSVQPEDMNPYTQLVLDEIDKASEGFAWWEAKMPSEISKVAQENIQPLLNGEMTGEEYMQSIQDVYDLNQ